MKARLATLRERLVHEYGVPGFYWVATHALRAILWVVGRWVVTGREYIPREGALLVVSNHLNNADPPILSAAIARRRVRYLAKIELFKLPFGVIPRAYGAIPIRRGEADIGAMLAAERILRRGDVLGMFPEGTRSRTGYLGTPHPGTALFALRTGATVLPCAMTGTERLRNPLIVFTKPRITCTIGEPITVERVKKPSEAQVQELTDLIFSRIASMLPASYLPPSYTGSTGETGESNGGDNPGI